MTVRRTQTLSINFQEAALSREGLVMERFASAGEVVLAATSLLKCDEGHASRLASLNIRIK